MGRFSSVQAYTDSNANARTVPYEQAAGSTQLKAGVVKPEKVVNPYGSAAGAGSGEFHVYRHARSRELERIETLKESEEEAKKDEEFRRMLEKNRQEDMERTEKLRKKRQRQKEAKQRKKNLAKAGVVLTSGFEEDKDEDFAYEPLPSSTVAPIAPGEAIGAEPGGEQRTEHEDGKPPAEFGGGGAMAKDTTVAEPSPPLDAVPSPSLSTETEPLKTCFAGDAEADRNNEDDDDDDDESVGPQPQPKRSKS